MKELMKKLKSQKGFTLMEMLIVVAIIAILVAVAVPVFNTQLTNAKTQVDAANLRSATSMAVTDYLASSRSTDEYYAFTQSSSTEAMSIASSYPAAAAPTSISGLITGQSDSSKTIVVKISAGGAVESAEWVVPK